MVFAVGVFYGWVLTRRKGANMPYVTIKVTNEGVSAEQKKQLVNRRRHSVVGRCIR